MTANCGLNENGVLVKDTGGDAINVIGEIKILAQSTIPENCLPCNGAAISRTAYPELFAAIGTTYGEGDGSTTFNVPDAEGVLYGNQGRTVGESVEEGLPNITGRIGGSNGYCYDAGAGAFWGSGARGYILSNIERSPGNFSVLNIDASRSNATYGASEHVQPQGITFNVVIVFE